MIKNIKFVVGMALVAASQLAVADTAEVKISDVQLSAGSPGWWYNVFTHVTWLPINAGTVAGLNSPSFQDSAEVWAGEASSSSALDGASMANATLTGKTGGTMNGVNAEALVNVSGGQSGYSFANVLSTQVQVPGLTTLTVKFNIDSLLTTGPSGQAMAYIQFCDIDFSKPTGSTDTCHAPVEALSMGGSIYDGTSLTASWTNPTDGSDGSKNWTRLYIGLTASADSVAAVPEPTTYALWLAGLAGIGFYRRRKA